MKVIVKVDSTGWSLRTKLRFEKAIKETAKQVASNITAEPERFGINDAKLHRS